MNTPAKVAIAIALVAGAGAGAWWWATRGQESTDDAQVDAHVTPVAARIGGTVLRVPVVDNQQVKQGDVLVELDTRDYQIALQWYQKAREQGVAIPKPFVRSPR